MLFCSLAEPLPLLLLLLVVVVVVVGGAEAQCGSGWQEHYRRLHAPAYQLLASTPPPLWEDELHSRDMRVAVALVREGKFKGQYSGGVGDRFTGLVTVFALSLLNDVPFFIDFPHLSKVLSRGSGNINWDINIRGTTSQNLLLV